MLLDNPYKNRWIFHHSHYNFSRPTVKTSPSTIYLSFWHFMPALTATSNAL